MGEWADGKMTGHGEMRWADGRRYAGEWLNNRCNGKGTLTYKDGRRYEGEYKNDKMHGKGVYEWSEGARYLGPLRPRLGACLYIRAHATCVCWPSSDASLARSTHARSALSMPYALPSTGM